MQLQRAIAIPRKDCRKQFMIITATTSYLLLDLLHCHPIFCGVKELGASQHNLDQLRTLELLKESIWVYISSCCSSYFYLFYLAPSNTCAICAMGHWESYPPCRSVHFGWPPPTPPLASPWDGPLGKVSRCVYASWHTMHNRPRPKYPQKYSEPNEHVSASSRCHLLSIQ